MKILKYILITCLLVGQVSCIDEKFTDEFKIVITPDAINSKTTLEINNSNGDETPISGNISFEGDGAEYIYTPDGSKEFSFNEGIISIGVLASANASTENPVNVLAFIEAEGYEEKSIEISFTGEDEFKYINTTVSREGDLPAGVEKISIAATLIDGKTTEELSLVSNNSDEGVSIVIPEGSVLTDDEGNIISDSNVSFEMSTYDLSNEFAIEGLPEGGFIREDEVAEEDQESRASAIKKASTIDASGDVILPISNVTSFYLKTSRARRTYRYWYSHCWRSWWSWRRRCHYHSYYRSYYYTVPAKVTKYIDGSIINPITGNAIKAGDKVNVYKNSGGTYRNLGELSVYKGSNNRLYVSYNAYSDGSYLFGFSPTQTDCVMDETSEVTLVNNGVPQSYKFVVTTANGRVFSHAYMYVGGDMTVNLSWAPNLQRTLSYLRYSKYYNCDLKIYTARGNVKVFEKKLSLCDVLGGTINLDNSSDCTYNANFDVTINCPSVNLVLNYLPVFYKKTSDTYYKRYGFVSKGYIKGLTPCLEDNESYQFRVLYNGDWKHSPVKTGAEIKSSTKGISFDEASMCDFVESQLNR